MIGTAKGGRSKEASRFPDMSFGDPGSKQSPPFEVPASWFSVSDDLDD